MKVAVVCREHPQHYNGGFAIAAWNTARAAAEAGVDVTYITAERPDGFADAEMRNGVKIIWMKGTTNVDYPKFLETVKAAFPTYHVQHRFDLIHCHGYSGASLARDKEARCGLPILFHDHGSKLSYAQSVLSHRLLTGENTNLWENQHGHFLDDTFFRGAAPAFESDFKHMRHYDGVIATSTISQMDFFSRYMLKNVHLFLHPIYKRATIRTIRSANETPVIALFCGDLSNPWKIHVPSVLKLAPILKPRGRCVMVLIGGNPEPLAKTLKDAGIDGVLCTGHLPEAKALHELSMSDVMFECSISHMGTNLTGLSALSVGVPVIGFPTGGHLDMIGTQMGCLVDPMSDDLCSVFNTVINYREIHSLAATRRYERKFSPSVAGPSIRAVYLQYARGQ
jgi:glycosyltransferase involved in cell wall biosynthesis